MRPVRILTWQLSILYVAGILDMLRMRILGVRHKSLLLVEEYQRIQHKRGYPCRSITVMQIRMGFVHQ